jgi:hypothetical protein
MNTAPNPDQSIAQVLEKLKQARRLLLDPSPQNVDCCQALVYQCFEQAASLLKDPHVRSLATESLISQIRAIQEELNSIARLLDSAATFRRDLLRVISKVTPAETATEPAEAAVNGAGEEKARRLHRRG